MGRIHPYPQIVCDWRRQGPLRDDEERWSRLRLRLRRLSVRLVEASLQLPPRLFLNGVQFAAEGAGHLVRRGSYATVYRGQWRIPGLCKDVAVAVKDFHQYDPQSAGQPFANEAHYVQVRLNEIYIVSHGTHSATGSNERNRTTLISTTSEYLSFVGCCPHRGRLARYFGSALDEARQCQRISLYSWRMQESL